MQIKNKNFFMQRMLISLLSCFIITAAQAGTPLWTFEPLTATKIVVPANGTTTVQYRITNQASRSHTLTMPSIQGIRQITTGLGVCGNSFVLPGKGFCILSLQVNGSQLSKPILDGPVVCLQGNPNQCYRPSSANILRITQGPAITNATITVAGSPLTLTVNASAGQLTINNTSTDVFATNITSNFTGTALAGNVIETGNTCANVPPGASCTLTYTPGNTVVPQTNFVIQGSNTNAETAAIAIQSGSTLTAINPSSGTASGGTGVILTGTGLTGVTSVTFDGIPATSVNAVNSTTVTAVTPASLTIGTVNAVINTPAGGATLANGYTYVTTAVGQPSRGGIIACLNGGINNLIAATADNMGVQWGGLGTLTNAQSNINGDANTTTIVAVLGTNGGITYAAQICDDYAVDSQGNMPCQPGNTCYNDWFLPAGDNVTASGQLNCLFTNRVAVGGFSSADYLSSTELDANLARAQDFGNGAEITFSKNLSSNRIRCVRAFTP